MAATLSKAPIVKLASFSQTVRLGRKKCDFVAVFDPLPTSEAAAEFLQSVIYPILTRGLVELCKEKPAKPVVRSCIKK